MVEGAGLARVLASLGVVQRRCGAGYRLVQGGTVCQQRNPHPEVLLLWGKHDSGLESKLEPA